jgi:uncharacterized ferritin-like protein (DUF455 family)
MSAAAILKLQASGFSAEQVSALAELIDTQAATKGDVEASEHRLELKITDVKTGLEAKIADVRTGLEAKIADVRTGLEAKIADVKTGLDLKITAVEGKITLLHWMMGFILAFQLLILGKLFIH